MMRGCFMLLGSLYGDTPYRENPLLCEINGMICTLACCGSLWTMMFIAINRYTYVCRNSLYTRIFTLKGTLASICLIWTFTLAVDLPRLLGFGGHAYSGLYLFCSGYVQEGAWWFNVGFYTIMALVVPMIVITICYAKIWRLASRSSAALDNVSKRRQREQRQLLVSLVAIYLTFLVTWMPYAFLVLVLGLKVEVYARMPMEFFLLLDLWAHSNAAINFFIYGATHSGFRKAYKHLLAKVIPCYNPKIGNPTLHSKSAPGRKSGTAYDETRET
ncbi:melatonin receptor type 1C-like [Convolutriloba macropyga]|uniref:melatonin receptor type 1C-like n=1 Tax=Convolutriloba macropyga TaxID=536237 RepID=UPI003F5288EE